MSPSATASPTLTSIFQTVPVMCASMSAMARHNIPPCSRKSRQSARGWPSLAARNEADRVGDTLDALRAALPGARLFVADDASTDGTAEVAMSHGATVISRRRSHGKGGNVTAAAEAALSELARRRARARLPALRRGPRRSAGELVALVEAVECR